ncbi:5'-methylthioadenosine/S-adenosylhomocysteine nucleosidase family protein [Actinomadura rupiterrae]|uniref:5'-methylthioadenosine/S-adenosylhomocysteine nucleosidase family protein n=1 Tax=Actinomadura rupiterrae TaxID=559627 RepID=UPI0020A4FFEF|nr:hypothetical protein [Actinomadura rupiterrae]MCP2343145.1 adenosylhomocysteine nucleosidase [Actinomadura rupiterrae]
MKPETVHNEGVATFGGSTRIQQSAVGRGASVDLSPVAHPAAGRNDGTPGWDVGIITVLAVEANAVRLALGLRPKRVQGLNFDLGHVEVEGAQPARLVATRTLNQGQRSTVIAFDHLRRHYDPKVVVLIGIGGGIHPRTSIGDVVVATRVVYYDLRKELPQHTQHRGEEKEAPAAVGHAVNAFFTDHGEPARLAITDPGGASRTPSILSGLIGSGDAVIADRDSEIIGYLSRFNDKILAVDMEAGGLSQACHEQSVISDRLQGWLVVRGISDDAGSDKNDDHQAVAAWHAATAFRRLLPYLVASSGS